MEGLSSLEQHSESGAGIGLVLGIGGSDFLALKKDGEIEICRRAQGVMHKPHGKSMLTFPPVSVTN
jgi:hypothetical protein